MFFAASAFFVSLSSRGCAGAVFMDSSVILAKLMFIEIISFYQDPQVGKFGFAQDDSVTLKQKVRCKTHLTFISA